MVRKAQLKDAGEISEIYNYYITDTVITFEEDELSSIDIQERIQTITEKLPWLVFEDEGKVVGYAYASEWKSRCAYRNSVESTVYLQKGFEGRGIGSQLYRNLLEELKGMGYHTVIGGIALPNEASVWLHEKFKFEKVAHFREVGYKFDQWIDVGYWQLLL